MAAKLVILFVALFAIYGCLGAILPVPAAYIAPYASSYTAHVVNHAIAAPVAAPLVAHAPVAAAYSPYSAYPYAYNAPLVLGK